MIKVVCGQNKTRLIELSRISTVKKQSHLFRATPTGCNDGEEVLPVARRRVLWGYLEDEQHEVMGISQYRANPQFWFDTEFVSPKSKLLHSSYQRFWLQETHLCVPVSLQETTRYSNHAFETIPKLHSVLLRLILVWWYWLPSFYFWNSFGTRFLNIWLEVTSLKYSCKNSLLYFVRSLVIFVKTIMKNQHRYVKIWSAQV